MGGVILDRTLKALASVFPAPAEPPTFPMLPLPYRLIFPMTLPPPLLGKAGQEGISTRPTPTSELFAILVSPLRRTVGCYRCPSAQ